MSRSWSRKQLVIVQQRGLTFSSADAERLQKAAVGPEIGRLRSGIDKHAAP